MTEFLPPEQRAPASSPQEQVRSEIAATLFENVPEHSREQALRVGDGKSLATALLSGDHIQAGRALGILTGHDSKSITAESIDTAMSKALYLQRYAQLPYSELFDALATLFIASSGRGGNPLDQWKDWSHSLHHNFSDYGSEILYGRIERRSDGREKSLLLVPSSFPAAARLFAEAARRAVEVQSIDSLSLIAGSIVQYNLDHIDATNLDGAFPFRPTIDDADAFAQLMRSQGWMKGLLFFTAETPRAFLTEMVQRGHRITSEIAREPELLSLIRDALPPDVVSRYIETFMSGEATPFTLEEVEAEARFAATESEVVPGVFIDVDGTLVVNGALRAEFLQQRIQYAKRDGQTITIVSGGDPASQTARLRELGVPEELLPVVSKSTLRGKIVEKLYDDVPPNYQGFRAQRYSPAW